VKDVTPKTHDFNDGARDARSLPGGIHYKCYLPMKGFHDPTFKDMRMDCDLIDLVRDVVVLAAEIPRIQPIFGQMGIENPGHNYRELGESLASPASIPFKIKINEVFTKIVLNRLANQ